MKSTHIVGGMAGIVGIIAVLLTLASGSENIVYEWPEGIGDSPGNPIELLLTLASGSENIVYEWPEGIGDSPSNPIELPFTLDENYLVSNLGIGGCEMTIHGILETRPADGYVLKHEYNLYATVRAVDDIASCEIKGLYSKQFNTRPFASKDSIIKTGEILIGVYLNLREKHEWDPDSALYGFKLRETHIGNHFRADGITENPARYPSWSFDPSEPHDDLWLPGTKFWPNKEGYPASIELVFLDVEKVKNLKYHYSFQGGVYLLDKAILYSKFLEFKTFTPP